MTEGSERTRLSLKIQKDEIIVRQNKSKVQIVYCDTTEERANYNSRQVLRCGAKSPCPQTSTKKYSKLFDWPHQQNTIHSLGCKHTGLFNPRQIKENEAPKGSQVQLTYEKARQHSQVTNINRLSQRHNLLPRKYG